ncbi:MAG: hypothetical protein A2X94_06880 [Bdellovibrionales bacterium GWB1_55_8]|nr:MAG: hypothetical protein A2X94_06880 [Bdellovibrionales bacterium GWB1_55_8]
MSKFTPHVPPSSQKNSGIKIKEDAGTATEPRVVKLGGEAEKTVVKSFEFGALSEPGNRNYADVKKKFGALAVTDPERAGRAQKDSRFKLNSLLRDPLSIEEEERRVIDEKVRARVAAMADEARVNASAQGYEEGLKKGYHEAFTKFQREGEERLGSFSKMIAEFEGAKEQVYHANEKFLLDLVYRIGRMVLLREMSTDGEYVLRLARELIEKVGVRENIKIHISQQDAETAEMVKRGLEQSLGNLKNLSVEPSDQVKLGGCVIETEWNAINASVEAQLQSISSALFASSTEHGSETT